LGVWSYAFEEIGMSPGDRLFAIEFVDPGVETFAFTFG
jgi:hypothetical protein